MTKIIDTHVKMDENGVIKSEEKTFRFRSEEPNYIKIYLEDISYLYSVPKGSSDLIYELFNYTTYGTNEIIINSFVKQKISKKINTTIPTINNNLTKLVQKGILNRPGSGVFILNPYLFGKGDWKSVKNMRDENIELKITYNKETGKREILGKIENEEQKIF